MSRHLAEWWAGELIACTIAGLAGIWALRRYQKHRDDSE